MFHIQMINDLNDMFKCSTSCANTHHDVMIFKWMEWPKILKTEYHKKKNTKLPFFSGGNLTIFTRVYCK